MSRSCGRRWVAAMLASLVVEGALLLGPAIPVSADHGCALTPWPRFAKVAPTAKRIVVGTVVEHANDLPPQYPISASDPSDSFRLRVDEVLRGRARESLWVRRLSSGLPLADSRTECGWFQASLGDRIAIAFQGRLARMNGPVTSVAWVDARPTHEKLRAERLTLGRVRALSGHERDGSSLPPDRGITPRPLSIDEIREVGAQLVRSMVRGFVDDSAREACTAAAGSMPGLEPRSGQPVLVAAYRMSPPELESYADRLGATGERLRSRGGTSPAVDLCILDGRFTESELPRALVLLGADGPTVISLARCHPSDIPLDFERSAPLARPRHYISRC